MTEEVNEFIGSAKARIQALERRADKWDTAIDTLKQFQSKTSALVFIAMFFISFLMNYLIKFLGWA